VRVAVVDLGTNTCRLFLAEARAAGAAAGDAPSAVETVERLTTVVRLGQGVDRTGRLDVAAVTRTRDCLAGYAPRLEAFVPERRLLVATSVLRDAADGREFLEGVERDFALPWCVLAGEEEGALAFRGGTAELAGTGPSPLVLVDIGGGSTEFAVGEPGGAPKFVRSLDVGVVRLTERFITSDPPAPADLAELEHFTSAAIAEAVPATVRGAACGAVGVAGTYTTLVANKLGLREYRSELVHGHVLSRADIDGAIARFSALTNAERGRLPGIQPGREDVILAGAIIAREALRAFGLAEVRCSEADILEGAALGLAEGTLTAG
jgi:exopolyphosphatase / guanosine-5'-triphosphate,3'-diphosphate pyrophosphatase